jgi:hypothetical protein
MKPITATLAELVDDAGKRVGTIRITKTGFQAKDATESKDFDNLGSAIAWLTPVQKEDHKDTRFSLLEVD